MKGQSFIVSFLLSNWGALSFSSASTTTPSDLNGDHSDQSHNVQQNKKFLIEDFQQLLFTEINDELEAIKENLLKEDVVEATQDDFNRELLLTNEDEDVSFMEDHAQDVFDHLIDHAWMMTKSMGIVGTNTHHATNQTDTKNIQHSNHKSRHLFYTPSIDKNNSSIFKDHSVTKFPFLVCSRSPLLQSGLQRLSPMLQFTGAHKNDAIVVSNDVHQTCFQILTTHDKASILDKAISNDEYVILPMADMMKISSSTFQIVESKEWKIPNLAETIQMMLHHDESSLQWERILRVGLVPGLFVGYEQDTLLDVEVRAILQDLEMLGGKALQRHKNDQRQLNDVRLPLTISQAFSLTSLPAQPKTTNDRRLRQALEVGRDWRRSLQNGLEADHSCNSMFDQMEIKSDAFMKQFDIILNPNLEYNQMNDVKKSESSASNIDCVKSLIIGLSIHPHVLSIGAELPVSPDDFESQWITQSNTVGSTPLYDKGLTGAGQIVSVTDTGLDINHKHFGPTSEEVFRQWRMSERKVVRYDYSDKGDHIEPFQGHGTRVAGVIAGNAGDEADGVAKDAKIHMLDLEKQGGQISAPGPDQLFPLIYNGGRGAKITNGSWTSGYRPYTFRCRMFDASLRDNYDDILFVSSAGNSANDVSGKVMNTIGDPSSCKNVLAVGASQSHGNRLFPGDRGKDYLADFSSRGPTADGRMKPDVVAPGYKILAPRAHAKSNNYDETYETFGTSFAAPVVSGNAALVRQYFEEGWFPCGSKACNNRNRINPSGSLVKAVLMNGAIQTIRQVQKVPAGQVMDAVKEYDNNAGMGLINMKNSLPLQGINDLSAFATNNRSIGDGEIDYIIVKTKACNGSADSLRVTLAWYDPPGATNCAHCLINDLDLIVEKKSSTSSQVVEKSYFPNGLYQKDTKNNVERIRIAQSLGEVLKISVKATNLSTQNEKYSLIATGCFEVVEEKYGIQCVV